MSDLSDDYENSGEELDEEREEEPEEEPEEEEEEEEEEADDDELEEEEEEAPATPAKSPLKRSPRAPPAPERPSVPANRVKANGVEPKQLFTKMDANTRFLSFGKKMYSIDVSDLDKTGKPLVFSSPRDADFLFTKNKKNWKEAGISYRNLYVFSSGESTCWFVAFHFTEDSHDASILRAVPQQIVELLAAHFFKEIPEEKHAKYKVLLTAPDDYVNLDPRKYDVFEEIDKTEVISLYKKVEAKAAPASKEKKMKVPEKHELAIDEDLRARARREGTSDAELLRVSLPYEVFAKYSFAHHTLMKMREEEDAAEALAAKRAAAQAAKRKADGSPSVGAAKKAKA